jgi:hypothetical protein
MNDPVYKTIEITGTSAVSMEDAVNQAVSRASETLDDLQWFEVSEIRGNISDGAVRHWQVSTKIGLKLKDSGS